MNERKEGFEGGHGRAQRPANMGARAFVEGSGQ